MYLAECIAVERGMTFSSLMENAGTAAAKLIFNEFCDEERNVLIISGKGKNGGDGFVIAGILKNLGCRVKVLLPCGRPTDKISWDNMELLDSETIIETDEFQPLIDECDIIVDAVFGTGFEGTLDGKISALAEAVNKSGKTVVSIDIPSGAICDSAQVNGTCFEADMTLAVSALKPIHIFKPCSRVCGEVRVIDIGITEDDLEKTEGSLFTYSREDIGRLLPARASVSNKGTFGNALVIAGSKNMPGAAKIAVGGAVKSGVGLVTLAFPDAAYAAIAPCVTEQIILPCPSNEDGTFSASALDFLEKKSAGVTAALIGCGLGVNTDTLALVNGVIKHFDIPLVLDADALNCISKNPYILEKSKNKPILTPHPGEMSRLTGKPISEIVADPISSAAEFVKKYNCVLVLKGANTVVCESGSEKVYVNKTGNSGLAKGGSGDLLSGIIVSLLAQGMKPFEAACCAVFIHGDCADAVAGESSERGMTVTDMIDYLPKYFGRYERRRKGQGLI